MAEDPRVGLIAGGKYKILRLLGRGGMGSVYEAVNQGIGKRVALKFLGAEALADEQLRVRFHREARAAGSIESAHVAQVFDTGETERGEPFLVMELLVGEDLASILKREGKLEPSRAIDFAVQMLRGLRSAHAGGVVHRDLKPGNLFVTKAEDGRSVVKIVDFGVSKLAMFERSAVDPSSRLTQAGSLVGTPLYMSPEQISAPERVDARSDLFSAGAILYEMIAGAPPFTDANFTSLLMSICHRDATPLDRVAPGAPPHVARAVTKALAKDQAARFQSAEEFLAAIVPVPGTTIASEDTRDSARSSQQAASSSDPARSSQPDPSRASQPDRPADKPMPSDRAFSMPGAELKTYTAGGATLWISQPQAFSMWRGEVAAPDRLRIEARDGTLHELRLEPVDPNRPLRLGRTENSSEGERNDLVYPDVASRRAALLRHDGVRWWLQRRDECSVPVQVGARSLARKEEAPLVHGTFVLVGGMRATMVDRRYVTPAVPAGTVDPATGFLARTGMEQEIAAFLQRQRAGALVLLRPRGEKGPLPADPRVVAATVAIHKTWPSLAIGHLDGTTVLLVAGDSAEVTSVAKKMIEVAKAAGMVAPACGTWRLEGEGVSAGREIELAVSGVQMLSEGEPREAPVDLRVAKHEGPIDFEKMSADRRYSIVLFGIEDQSALQRVGAHVIPALEQELAAVVATHADQGARIAPMAAGVVGAFLTKKVDPSQIGSRVQCDWHARPPIIDGKAELPRGLSWEVHTVGDVRARAKELASECGDPHGVLSALSGGLPYPIAGRVHAAIAASSAVERVKMLFDVLEGTWRFIATVLASAFFVRPMQPGEPPAGFDAMLDLSKRLGSRDGYALGTWRELARTAAKAFVDKDDAVGAMARDVIDVRLAQNQTFETLSNLMQAERNGFAHGHYNEARAAADLGEFEQMTRTLLRALRPLGAWTLVTVEKTEPDLYGDLQTVEFVDHTGPFHAGMRRRVGLNSPVRIASVMYLARWREGLLFPLEPMMKRLVHEDRFDIYWMDHLPRGGQCTMSSAVTGNVVKVACDVRKLPPVLRMLIDRS